MQYLIASYLICVTGKRFGLFGGDVPVLLNNNNYLIVIQIINIEL